MAFTERQLACFIQNSLHIGIWLKVQSLESTGKVLEFSLGAIGNICTIWNLTVLSQWYC